MKGLLATFIIYVILVDTVLSLSESDSCDGEHCGSVISMPIMDNMKASLKADLDVSKMNKHLKAYIQQEIEIGVRTAMENLMKQMIENKTEKMNSEIKTLSGMKNAEITVRLDDAVERQTIKTNQMELLIKNKTEEMLTFIKDNEVKSMASFEVKMEEFKQIFEQKNKLSYAFFSHLSSPKTNLKSNAIVIFDVVPLNIGGAYDGTTGKFTCKEDGIYTFSWTTQSSSKIDFTSALVVDGTLIASNVVDNDETEDALTGSMSVIVKMTKGQQAWIKFVEPVKNFLNHSWSGPSSVFSGFKV
ncbi:Hypothetical predicted protein [Mytilus galloprovincialis]|uniref:C1q domain-containing protein n=1 Tax=Mytilus galloprovincialis TaxID=29158 RepID=A0A8B6BDP5_MYTGA|nr:Hypothetical predicted protein [Mytilus galloprovincialis]